MSPGLSPRLRVLLCPLGSPGFSFPGIAIGLELLARGHAVAFATERWLGPLLRAHGLDRLANGPNDAPSFETPVWHAPGAVARQVRHLEAALAAFRPDVLVTSALALGPLVVAETCGLPVVVVGLLSDLLPTEGTRRAEFQAALDASRASLGLGPRDVTCMRGDLYLSRSVPELEPSAHPIGACAWEPPAPRAAVDWLAAARRDGRRVVYAHQARTFGAPGFWPLLSSALPSDVRVAASTSRMDTGPPGVSPGALVGPLVPQAAILAHAVAAVCSGSTAAVVGALSSGVPIVLVPAGGEQPVNAALLVQAGVGVSVPADQATPARLAHAFEQALRLDPAPRLAIQQAFSRIDGPRRAAEWIEGLC